MKTYWACFFVDDTSVIRRVDAPSMSAAMELADRYAKAASRVVGKVHQVTAVTEKYPDPYVLNEAQVSDLEYMFRKMKGKEASG